MGHLLMKSESKGIVHSLKLHRLATCLTLLLLLVVLAPAVKGRSWSYTSEGIDFVLDFPSAEWRAVIESGIAHPRTYFVYDDQASVKLNIRRQLVESGLTPADLIEHQRRWDRVSLRGYVKTQTEAFEGRLGGGQYGYEYISEGKRVARLNYYLQANTRTIYRLEFTGSQEELSALSEQIDFIARRFRLR